jgi:hypothetical protein
MWFSFTAFQVQNEVSLVDIVISFGSVAQLQVVVVAPLAIVDPSLIGAHILYVVAVSFHAFALP